MPTIPLLSAPDNVASSSLPAGAHPGPGPAMLHPSTLSPTLAPAVRANTGMFDAVGAAGAHIGEGISAVGDLGFRIKAAKDYAAVTKASTVMQAAYQQFQTELEDPNNPENGDTSTWLPRWQERTAQLKETMGEDPAIKGLSAGARLHLDTQMAGWEKLSATQLGHQATVRQLEDAKGTVLADYNTKLRTGDLAGAVKTVSDAVPFGIIHKAEAQQLVASAARKVEHYQATSLIMQDPIAAEGALTDKDKDGKPVNFPHLDDDSRLTLSFEAARRARELRTQTASDLFQRQQDGNPAPADEVMALVQQGRLTAPQARAYLKPPKPEFDPMKFAEVMSDISTYDPTKDPNRIQYSKLMARAAYDADIKGPAAADAVELLKKKGDPKSDLNKPVVKAGEAAIEDMFRIGGYGQYQKRVPIPESQGGGFRTEINPGAKQAAQVIMARNLDSFHTWAEAHPNATHEEAQKYINSLNANHATNNASRLIIDAGAFGFPSNP